MTLNVSREVTALRRLPVRALVARYAGLFGEATAIPQLEHR
jgi:hypothetical protein